MTKSNKCKNGRSIIAKSTHCTSFGVGKQLPLQDFELPSELHKVLRNHLVEYSTNSRLCRNYMKLINNFANIDKIEPEYYLILFKILLYMENHELQLIAEKHNLRNQEINQCSDTFAFTVPTLNEDDPFISFGDTVKLHIPDLKRTYNSRITNIEQKKIYVSLSTPSTKIISLLSDHKVDVQFYPANWPLKCSHYVLHIICKHNLISLLYPKININVCTLQKNNIDWVNQSVAENPEQKIAVINILNQTAYPAPYILFGPPGTGKTTTLVEAICQIRKQHKFKNILVCASSNAAADEITKRLLAILPCKDIFRMYATSKHWSSVDKQINHSSNFVNNTVLYLPKEILILKKIVITTLVTCVRLMALNLKKDHFSYIFIDEASQCVELESLIPFALASSQNKRGEGMLHAQIIIAGDPYQLGPVIHCKKIEHLLGKSLIERLMECEPYQKVNNEYNSCYITKLIRNHRNQKAIIHVPNKLFYDNELLCCTKSNANTLTLNWTELSNKQFPIIFFAVKGKETRVQSGSVYNKREIDVITYYTKKLVQAKLGTRKITKTDIGIITPFRQQKIMIEKNFKGTRLHGIDVGTVETFQGQEREIILLTTVRSKVFTHDGKEHIGFLSNPKRFNVALTRAKNLLIIVGDPSVLCKNKNWNILWEYCVKNNACSTVDTLDLK